MNKDFASTGRSTRAKSGGGARKKPAASASRKSQQQQNSAPWTWFLAGMLCGLFLAGLLWLASQQPEAPVDRTAAAEPREERPQPRFDFYTLLPEQRIDVEVDPEAMASASAEPDADQFLLQAGSFKQPEDADRRRAELLLLGLDASVEEANTDNGRWYRVYIGPFDSRSKLQSARSLTAQQGIDTLLLKRPGKSG